MGEVGQSHFHCIPFAWFRSLEPYPGRKTVEAMTLELFLSARFKDLMGEGDGLLMQGDPVSCARCGGNGKLQAPY